MPADAGSAAPDTVRIALLQLATREFAARGLAGARLETIAAEAGITRAMIYYYFGGRDGLYAAVLEAAYQALWHAENAVDTDRLAPEEALRTLVAFRIGYYIEHPEFVAVVQIENQQQAQSLKRLRSLARAASPALAHTADVLARGQASGVFRKDVDVVDLFQLIVSLGFFNVANRHTFGAFFKRDWKNAPQVQRFVSDAVLRFVRADHPDPPAPRAAQRARALPRTTR